MIRCTAILLLVSLAYLQAVQHTETMTRQHAKISGEDREYVMLVGQMVRTSYSEVDKWLGITNEIVNDLSPEDELIIDINEDEYYAESTVNFSYGHLCVNSHDFHVYSFYNIVRLMMLRRARQLTGEQSWRCLHSVDWMAAAICNRIANGGKGIRWNYQPDYSRQLRMYVNNRFPDVVRLMDFPPPENDKNLFLLYMMHCDALALCFEECHPSAKDFAQIFSSEYFGATSSHSVQLLLRSSFNIGNSLQEWFERNALRKCVVGRSQSPLDDIAQQLDQLLTLPVTGINGLEMVPLHEVAKKYEKYSLDSYALVNLQNDLFALMQRAPYLLRESLQEIIASIALLQNEKRSEFVKSMNAARRKFDSAVKLNESISHGLDDIIDGKSAVPMRLFEQLEVYDRLQNASSVLLNLKGNLPKGALL